MNYGKNDEYEQVGGCIIAILLMAVVTRWIYLYDNKLFWEIFRVIFWGILSILAILGIVIANIVFFVFILIIIKYCLQRFGMPVPGWLENEENIVETAGLICIAIVLVFLVFLGYAYYVGNITSNQIASVLKEKFVEKPIPFIESSPTHISETPTFSPMVVMPESPIPNITPTPEKKTYETIWQDDEYIRDLDQNDFLGIGSMYVDYHNDMFSVSIDIPREYDNLKLSSFERIYLPLGSNGNEQLPMPYWQHIPKFVQYPADCFYSQNILVYPIIDAQLTSEDFEILSFEPDTLKILDVTSQYPSVSWRWIIKIRNYYSSKGSVSLSLFLDEISDPSWFCTFSINLSR